MTTERTILKARGIDRLSAADMRAFVACADALGIAPDWLACVVSFETGGSFDPAQRNMWAAKDAERRGLPYSGAIGLIQVMPSTAKNLGTSTAELAAMSFTEQLKYVRAYLAPYARRIKSLDDCYLAVFYPMAIGREEGYVVGRRSAEGFIGRVYEQNAGFDRDRDGEVTKREICETIRAVRDAAGGRRLIVPEDDTAPVDAPVENTDDESKRVIAEQVLASVYATADRMVAELVGRDMARASEAPGNT